MGLLIGTGLLFQVDGLRYTAASTSALSPSSTRS